MLSTVSIHSSVHIWEIVTDLRILTLQFGLAIPTESNFTPESFKLLSLTSSSLS